MRQDGSSDCMPGSEIAREVRAAAESRERESIDPRSIAILWNSDVMTNLDVFPYVTVTDAAAFE